ncbi:MAG: 50S ribosomal protein L25/general stress protein Ctc [Bacillota bacterium]
METLQLDAKVRTGRGKGYMNRMRNQGSIPAVLYGQEVDSIPLLVLEKTVEKVITSAGENAFLQLKVETNNGSKEYNVLMREVQRHPVKKTLSHIDFYQVSMSEKLETTVPIILVGESIGIAEGGILQHRLRELAIRCLPADIPAAVEVDISNLKIGDSVSVADIPASEKVEYITDPSTVVAVVSSPRAEEEAEEAEELGVEGQEGPAAEAEEQNAAE